MTSDPLLQPVGERMRPASTVPADASLSMAADRMRESADSVVAVLDGFGLVGVVTEASLAQAVADGAAPDASLADAIRPSRPITPWAMGAEALRRFHEDPADTLIVADEVGRVLGAISPSDLFPKRAPTLRPPLIGGMATPFGVYLTTGSVRAGAGDLALVTTGMTLFTLFLVAHLLSFHTAVWMDGQNWPRVGDLIANFGPLVLFLGGMRLLPLAGIHAAEHQVVHAIERGEELTPAVVRRMPRVHPRCGTNLAVGASLFLGLGTSDWVSEPSLRLLMAAIITLIVWRPLGNLVQYWVTTRTPTDKHLQMGLRSGQELLKRYATAGRAVPTLPVRLWNSGMFHVITGSLLCYGFVWALSRALGVDLGL